MYFNIDCRRFNQPNPYPVLILVVKRTVKNACTEQGSKLTKYEVISTSIVRVLIWTYLTTSKTLVKSKDLFFYNNNMHMVLYKEIASNYILRLSIKTYPFILALSFHPSNNSTIAYYQLFFRRLLQHVQWLSLQNKKYNIQGQIEQNWRL